VGIDLFPTGGLVVIGGGAMNGFGIEASGHEGPSLNVTLHIV
jgi:hypothetical protein